LEKNDVIDAVIRAWKAVVTCLNVLLAVEWRRGWGKHENPQTEHRPAGQNGNQDLPYVK